MHLSFKNPRIRFSGARASIARILIIRGDRNSITKCDEMSDEISVLLVVAMFGLTCHRGFDERLVMTIHELRQAPGAHNVVEYILIC